MLSPTAILGPGIRDGRGIAAGAIALAEVLAENKHISHLDLRDNDVRVAGLMGLQLAHRMNHTLLNMDTPKFYKVEQVSRPVSVLGKDCHFLCQ